MPDQYQTVTVPGEGEVQFPSSMSDDDIATAIKGHLAAKNPSLLSRAASFVGDTLKKTADKMNVENTLHAVSDFDSGNTEAIKQHLIPSSLTHMIEAAKASQSGDMAGMIKHTFMANLPGSDEAAAFISKLRGGDYSGAISDALPYAFAAAGGSESLPEGAISDAGSAVSKTIRKDPMIAAAKTLFPSAVDVAGEALNPVIAPAMKAGQALSKAVTAFKKQKALNTTQAAAAAQRANPRTPLYAAPADIPSSPDLSPQGDIGPAEIAQAQEQLLQKAAARRVSPAPVQPNALRIESAKVRDQLANPVEPSEQPASSVDVATAQQALRDKAAARKVIATNPVAAESGVPEIDPEILDAVSRQYANKPFSAVRDSLTKQKIIDFASKLKPKEQIAPVKPVSQVEPMQKFEQAADVLTDPQNGPVGDRINQALAHTEEAMNAVDQKPEATSPKYDFKHDVFPSNLGDMHFVQAFDPNNGTQVGNANFTTTRSGALKPYDVYVNEANRRQGVASGMYDFVKQKSGINKIIAGDQQPDGKAFRQAYDSKASGIPSSFQESFPGDKGGTLSPQETNARNTLAINAVMKLHAAGFQSSDLETEAGKANVVEYLSKIPGLSKNKAISQYLASPETIDAIHTLLKQWPKYRDLMGIPK